MIRQVDTGSEARGISVGSIIVSVNGTSTAGMTRDQVTALVQEHEPRTPNRKPRPYFSTLTLTPHPWPLTLQVVTLVGAAAFPKNIAFALPATSPSGAATAPPTAVTSPERTENHVALGGTLSPQPKPPPSESLSAESSAATCEQSAATCEPSAATCEQSAATIRGARDVELSAAGAAMAGDASGMVGLGLRTISPGTPLTCEAAQAYNCRAGHVADGHADVGDARHVPMERRAPSPDPPPNLELIERHMPAGGGGSTEAPTPQWAVRGGRAAEAIDLIDRALASLGSPASTVQSLWPVDAHKSSPVQSSQVISVDAHAEIFPRKEHRAHVGHRDMAMGIEDAYDALLSGNAFGEGSTLASPAVDKIDRALALLATSPSRPTHGEQMLPTTPSSPPIHPPLPSPPPHPPPPPLAPEPLRPASSVAPPPSHVKSSCSSPSYDLEGLPDAASVMEGVAGSKRADRAGAMAPEARGRGAAGAGAVATPPLQLVGLLTRAGISTSKASTYAIHMERHSYDEVGCDRPLDLASPSPCPNPNPNPKPTPIPTRTRTRTLTLNTRTQTRTRTES